MKTLTTDLLTNIAKKSKATAKANVALALDKLMSELFQEQLDFVTDKAQFRSLLCPRRAGKTFAIGVLLIRTALTRRRSNCLYLTKHQNQSKKVLWGVLKNFCYDYGIPADFHGTDLVATFENGSTIHLSGAETIEDADKFRGLPRDVVVIDEADSIPGPVLEYLLEEVVGPALLDRIGTLVLGGTPGHALAGTFYKATVPGADPKLRVRPFSERHKGGKYAWSFHTWNMEANIKMPHQWAEALEMKERLGWADEDPKWRREYLAQWCPSADHKVYQYDEARNGSWVNPATEWGLPPDHEWVYLLGLDLGFEDDTAIVVAAYSETFDKLIEVYSVKHKHMTIPDIASEVSKALRSFDVEVMVADTGALGKMIIETLSEQYGLYFEKANKKEKPDHIELLNSDLINGKVWLLPNGHVAAEMKLLQWLDDRKKKEDPSLDNHACDAFLYLWRHARHHFWVDKVAPDPKKHTMAWLQKLEDESLRRLEKGPEEHFVTFAEEMFANNIAEEDLWT